MRALTVRQPWAWAIVHGGKDVENRTQNIAGGYRGPVAIHAALGWSDEAGPWMDARVLATDWDIDPRAQTRGAIIGVVDLEDVHKGHNTARSRMQAVRSCYQPGKPFGPCSPWAMPDHHHLVLANPRPLVHPVPCRGKLGLWTLPDDVHAAVLEQVPATHSA